MPKAPPTAPVHLLRIDSPKARIASPEGLSIIETLIYYWHVMIRYHQTTKDICFRDFPSGLCQGNRENDLWVIQRFSGRR